MAAVAEIEEECSGPKETGSGDEGLQLKSFLEGGKLPPLDFQTSFMGSVYLTGMSLEDTIHSLGTAKKGAKGLLGELSGGLPLR